MKKGKIRIISAIICILFPLTSCNYLNSEFEKKYSSSSFDNTNLLFDYQNLDLFVDTCEVKRPDTLILENYKTFFKKFIINSGGNVTNNENNVIWLRLSIDTIVAQDYVVKCFPLYKKVTFYYFTPDSLLVKQTAGSEVPFSEWRYKTTLLCFDLPKNSLNHYFIKYELNRNFRVAAFQLITGEDIVNYNFKIFLTYGILLSWLSLIACISFIYYILNKEIRNLYYALYALFYGIFSAASFNIWYFLTGFQLNEIAYMFYIPFSLSCIFSALYIKESIENNNKKITYIFYSLIIIKSITIVLTLFDVTDVYWTNEYFWKIDIVIYSLLSYMVIIHAIQEKTISSFWLLVGTLILAIYQFLHLLYVMSEWLNLFIILDIIWFGIGMAVYYKTNKQQKINALNNVITITQNHNQDLEIKIEERTKKLRDSELQLKGNLNTIAELNKILQTNNISLSKNVAELEVKRTLNKELGFEEFMLRFPDKESCLQLLSKLKWGNGYICDICGNTSYISLKNPDEFARKCTKCSKVRSASSNTIFHNIKFPLEKAFYILFLTTSSKNYTIEQISEVISMRTGTIGLFKKKVEQKMEEKRFSKNVDMTWQDLIL